METIKKSLKKYGLDDKEILIFIHLLSNQNRTSYGISKTLSLPQSTVHNKLVTLLEKNIINSVNINNVRYYNTQDLDSFKQNLVEKLSFIKEALPEMENLKNKSQEPAPKVRFYTDSKNSKLVWEEMLKSYKQAKPSTVYATSHGDLFKFLPRYLPQWVKKRRELPHKVNLIYPESQRNDIGWIPDNKNESIKFMPDEFLNASEITTYENKTAIFYFDDEKPETIVIESERITDMFNRLLKFMWQHAKK